MTVLVYCTFGLRRGQLHHALFEKSKGGGWYWDNFYADLVHNLGYLPAWLALAALVCAILSPLPLLDRRRIPLVYALCYVIPFVFLVSRATTLTRGYCVYGLTGLLGLVALAPTNVAAIWRWLRLPNGRHGGSLTVALYALTSICLVAAAGSSTYKLYPNQKFLGVKGFQGTFKPPIGAAASAAFIARLAASPEGPSGRVFSDAYGGAGLEPPIMRLYFKRPFFAHYDAPRLAPWKAYARRSAEIGFAVIRPENAKLVKEYFPELKLAASITTDGKSDPILLVYARGHLRPPIELSAEEGITAYRQSFPKFCAS